MLIPIRIAGPEASRALRVLALRSRAHAVAYEHPTGTMYTIATATTNEKSIASITPSLYPACAMIPNIMITTNATMRQVINAISQLLVPIAMMKNARRKLSPIP